MTASTASAATVPVPAERQSRAVPAASTIVVASTASTTQARKTAINNAVGACSHERPPVRFIPDDLASITAVILPA